MGTRARRPTHRPVRAAAKSIGRRGRSSRRGSRVRAAATWGSESRSSRVAVPAAPHERRELDTERCRMKAIVVTDQAAGTAGMTLAERPEPDAAGNDVVVAGHAAGFTPGALAGPPARTH